MYPGYVSLTLGEPFVVGQKQKLLADNMHFWLSFSRILKVLYKEGWNIERERSRRATEEIDRQAERCIRIWRERS